MLTTPPDGRQLGIYNTCSRVKSIANAKVFRIFSILNTPKKEKESIKICLGIYCITGYQREY